MRKILILLLFFSYFVQAQNPVNSYAFGPTIDYLSISVSDQVNASNHDAESRLSDGAYTLTSTGLEMGINGADYQRVGFYFNGLNIPADAIIDNATIQFTAFAATTGAVDLKISGQKSTTPAVFAASNGDLIGRARTTTEVIWAPSDWGTINARTSNETTSDFSTVISEIIQGGSYSQGDPIVVFIESNDVDTDYRTAISYDNTPAQAATISVDYRIVDPGIIDIFPTGSAASIGAGEADSTSGWSFVSSTGSSVETDSHDGASAIQITMSSGGNGRGEISIPVTTATDYTITFWYRVTGATTRAPGLTSWTGVTTSPSVFFTEDNTWHEETVTVTTNSTTMLMRFYADRSTGSGTGTILIDEILIQETP